MGTDESGRVDDRDVHGLVELDEAACFRHLASDGVGRLGFSAGGLPVIHPVNYFLDDRTIVFRTEAGAKQRAAVNHDVACLEIDRFDALSHTGWSVLATGRLKVATAGRAEELARLPLEPWSFPGASFIVELPVELLTGRSIDRRVR
jgi:nitroimidazol reductase NimA-like FMN-containing flavoprotein (pyridoxamine 5'-phosphate oxidase superfamily)